MPLITLGKENTKGQRIHMLKLGCKVKKHFSGTANGISFIRHSSHAVELQTSRVFRDLGGNLVQSSPDEKTVKMQHPLQPN